MVKKASITLFALVFIFVGLGCSSREKLNTDTAEGAFKLAQRYEKDERFEEAITYFSEVKNKHPYSRYAVDAELKIADIEFARENFIEAENAYKLFKDLHPEHPRIDYVTFRLGLSLYKQLPATIDRDLALASRAIIYFDEVVNSHAKSEFVQEAMDHREKAKKMTAEKDLYIAKYYFIRDHWESALGRYEDLLRNHQGLGFDKAALLGATLSAYKAKEMDKAKNYFKQLLAKYPKSPELETARKELADGF